MNDWGHLVLSLAGLGFGVWLSLHAGTDLLAKTLAVALISAMGVIVSISAYRLSQLRQPK